MKQNARRGAHGRIHGRESPAKRWISVTAAVSLFSLQTCLPEQVARDDAVHHLQHRRHRLGLCGQQQAQRDGKRQNPLAHRQPVCAPTQRSCKCCQRCAVL